jgi:phosphoenolpyruvate carboxykinase (ATP)
MLPTDLERHGLTPTGPVHWNLPPPALYEQALSRGEGIIAEEGAFVARTDPHTGRSPKDKFVVREPETEDHIAWGPVNVALSAEAYARLHRDVAAFLEAQELFVRDVWAGADRSHRLAVRVVSTSAWHSLFVHNMFLEPTAGEREEFEPGFTVLHAPEFAADPDVHGTRSGTFIVVNFGERTVLIGGTRYAGEIKKSVFSVLNYLLPRQGVLSMHCSANLGAGGDVALFFGLSGTGKTTLSADPGRRLIGDDEHGWTREGVFNFEGGNYAKVIRLSRAGEPLIWELADVAEAAGIPVQHAIFDRFGSDGAQFIRHGIPAALVGPATRYTHSPFEMIDERDLDYTLRLLQAWVTSA